MAEREAVTVVIPLPDEPGKRPIRLRRPLAGLTVNGSIRRMNQDSYLKKENILVRRPAKLNGTEVPTGTNPVLKQGDILTLDP